MIRKFKAFCLAVCMLAIPVLSFAAGDAPDATIELSGGTVAAGIGYTWGEGILHFQGKSIPVKVNGLSVASVGAGSIKASGDVYHLDKLADFNGNYTAVSAGLAIAGGGAATAMQNQNGVVIKLRTTTQGLQINLSVDGVALKLKN
ncbi:MAG TPA: hypothetical protein VF928_07305 [Usitatibacteraceae bacterium]